MRDAFGGVFTMNLLLVFIFIFVAFSAVSLNYAKAFRLKNDIIDFIETNEIIDLSSSAMESKHNELNTIIMNDNYNKSCENIGDLLGLDLENGEYKEDNQIKGYCYNGIYIFKEESKEINTTTHEKINYSILVAADWNLGALNKLLVLAGEQENSRGILAGSWVIKGKATVVAKKHNRKGD